MSQRELVFEPSEFRRRVAATQQAMHDAGIDVLVVCDPANMGYLTGYDNWSFYVPQAVVVSVRAKDPVFVAREMDLVGVRMTTFLDEADIVGYPEDYITDSNLHPMSFIASVIEQRYGTNISLGTEMDTTCFTPRAQLELEKGLPGARFADADLLVNHVRLVKSDAEIAVMRQAGAIATRGMEAALAIIAPGIRQCDAAAEIHRALIAGTKEFGGTAPIRPAMPSGHRTSASHLSWVDEPYLPQTSTNVELGGSRHMYHAGLSRTVFLGQPPKKLEELADVTHEGFEAALAAIRPGATGHDVHAAWNKVINRRGYEKKSRIGYSIGLGYPPALWIERTASLAEGDMTVLQPNMTFHCIMGMWMEPESYIISETVAVTEDGYETLSVLPRKLFAK